MLSACCVNTVSRRLGTEQPTYRASSRLAPAAHGRCLGGVSLRHRHSTWGLTGDKIHGGEWYRGIVYYLIPGKTKATQERQRLSSSRFVITNARPPVQHVQTQANGHQCSPAIASPQLASAGLSRCCRNHTHELSGPSPSLSVKRRVPAHVRKSW